MATQQAEKDVSSLALKDLENRQYAQNWAMILKALGQPQRLSLIPNTYCV